MFIIHNYKIVYNYSCRVAKSQEQTLKERNENHVR